jgi:hypothetical protein
MPEVPDYQEIFDASPKLAKLLDSHESQVECHYKWNDLRKRLQLFVMIDDETRQGHLVDSWDYIKIMREILENFQGPYSLWPFSPKMWKKLAYEKSTPEGGDMKPTKIAQQLNALVEIFRLGDENFRPPGDRPFDRPFDKVYVEDMIKNEGKRRETLRKKAGKK